MRLIPVFLSVFALALILSPFTVQPARAQAGIYTVSGLHVEATAASPAEALNAAIAQGRPRAWQILYRRLTRQADWAREPQLDAPTLLRLSRGFTIANERRSTTRYVADVTYNFNPDAVARILQAANISFSQTVARRILLVPMAPGFVTGPWAQALAVPEFRGSLVPFEVAGQADAASLNGLDFDKASWGDVSAAAARIGASEAALVQSVYANGKVTVNIRRLGLGQPTVKSSVDVPLQQTLGTTYPSAANAAVAAIEDLWKSRTAVNFNARATIIADVVIGSLAQWGATQSALEGLDNVTATQLVAMDMGLARVSITYSGSAEQLRDGLAAKGIALANRAGRWTITASR